MQLRRFGNILVDVTVFLSLRNKQCDIDSPTNRIHINLFDKDLGKIQ